MRNVRGWFCGAMGVEPGGWGRFALRFGVLQFSVALHGLAFALVYRSGLGLHSWGILETGLTLYVPLTYGGVKVGVGIAMTAIAWRAGVRPGLGTVSIMLLVGPWLDACNALIPQAGSHVEAGWLLALGVFTLGWASAISVKAGLGAGPRDAFMLAVAGRTGWRVGTARGVIEGTVFAVGCLLDRSQIGVGTVVLTLAIGPVVGWAFRVLRVPSSGAAWPARAARRETPRGVQAPDGASAMMVAVARWRAR